MKVLQINSVCGIGSTGRIATDIHHMLIDRKHESLIAYGRDLPKNCDNTLKIGTKYDVYQGVFLTRVFDLHGYGSKKSTEQLVEDIKKYNPDIIHLHNVHGYYVNIDVLFNYLRTLETPIIWTLHDCWSFTGHCANFEYVQCDRWKTGCYDCPEKKAYPASFILDRSKKNYFEKKDLFTSLKNLTIITPSVWLSKLVEQSYLQNYPIKVINNGIDLESFKPRASDFKKQHDIEGKYLILGVASVWERRKGLKYFLELNELLEENEVIVLVGLSKDQLEKLPKNIIGIAKTHNVEELAEIYSAADVFVNPTLEDNYPTTNLEAQACGTPVITFPTGGSPESISDYSGIITKMKTVECLRQSIDEIKERELKVHQNEIISGAQEFFSKDDKFKEYIELYEQLVGE